MTMTAEMATPSNLMRFKRIPFDSFLVVTGGRKGAARAGHSIGAGGRKHVSIS
jgi:hypothetical protein